jgi:hypothetical protein
MTDIIDDTVPMLTFSIGKDADDEIIVTVDWADEFDLLEWTEQQSVILQAMDVLEDTLTYIEDAVDDELFGEDDDEEDEEDEDETDPEDAA